MQEFTATAQFMLHVNMFVLCLEENTSSQGDGNLTQDGEGLKPEVSMTSINHCKLNQSDGSF